MKWRVTIGLCLLPTVSNICERVALNELTAYMTNKKCLTEHQSGNKKLHSTDTMNIMMSDKILDAMDSKKLTLLVLLDLRPLTVLTTPDF